MRSRTLFYAFLGAIYLLGMATTPAMAQDGLPGSPNFGYGACLDIEGYHIETAVQIASNYGLDWLNIDFDWGRYWPNPDAQPDWGALDNAMEQIGKTNLAVMISVTNAPSWAFDSSGPSSNWTSELVLRLARRYPSNFLAFELFPPANTYQGWGASPNPEAYAALLQSVHNVMQNAGFSHTMIAAGIDPSDDIQTALDFLQYMYSAGVGAYIPVVSLHIPEIAYLPNTAPEEVNGHTLRFFEEARQIMLNNNHQNGLIWITRFEWSPAQVSQPEEQAQWIQYAYLTMRPQLYLGMASFYCLNDPSSATSLLAVDGTPTAAFNALGELIAYEGNYQSVTHSFDN